MTVDSDPTTPPAKPEDAPRRRRLFDFGSGGWVLLLAGLLVVGIAAWRVLAVWTPSADHAIGDGRDITTYQFELTPALIPLDRVIPAGRWVRRDGLPTLEDPPTLIGAEVDGEELISRRKLLQSNRVIGVEINGEARAYPLWLMTWHEIANDTVGGEAICVTYAPLSDAAVVFRRPTVSTPRPAAGAAPAEAHARFGISGLLFNSSPLIYDRGAPGSESLWSPIRAAAVIGPAAAERKALDVLPSALTTWGAWLAAHPNTTVVAPDPGRSRVYKRDAYSTYFGDDRLRFPVEPLPPPGERKLKTPVVATLGSDGEWRVEDAAAVDPLDLSRPRIWCFWFAWHAIAGR